MQTQVLANPIPVFYMFSWNNGVCEGVKNISEFIRLKHSYIYEIDYNTDRYLKKYSIIGPSVYEIDYNTDRYLKIYSIIGPSVYEIDYNTDRYLKIYSIIGPSVYEIDYNTDRYLKIYRNY